MLTAFIQNNSLVSLFKFFKESKFSDLIRLLSNSTLGMFGQQRFENLAREFMLSTVSHDMPDWMRVVRSLILARLNNKEFSVETYKYFEWPQILGEPFVNFDAEPAPISQVKILMNAFYHAEQALLEIEAYDLDNLNGWLHVNSSLEVFDKLRSSTISHIYKLAHLLTHPDVDLTSIFGEEWIAVTSWFNSIGGLTFLEQLQTYKKTYADNLNISEETIKAAYNFGMVVGVGVNQLKPHQGNPDYIFMTNFSATLPSYLNQLAGFIQQHSSSVANIAPSIDKIKLNQLDIAAHHLLSSLNGLYTGRGVLLSANLLNYIHIIRHTLTISQSIFAEIGHLNDASQDVILSQFKMLKYDFFLSIIVCADTQEEDMMLAPGQCSQRLMDSMKPLYSQLVTLVGKVVDFSKNNGELRELDDINFMHKRLCMAYKRHATHETQIFLLNSAKTASKNFFTTLDGHRGKRLSELEPEVKRLLIEQFHRMKPYTAVIDVELSNTIVRSLLAPRAAKSITNSIYDLFDYASQDNLRKLTNDYPDRIDNLLLLRDSVGLTLNKLIATSKFYQSLSNSIIQSIYNAVNETSLCTSMNVDYLAAPLRNLADLKLSSAEIIGLYQDAKIHTHKVEMAYLSIARFLALLAPCDMNARIYELSPEIRQQLKASYGVFQEMVMTLVGPGISLDSAIVTSLSGQLQGSNSLQVCDMYLAINDYITNHIRESQRKLTKRTVSIQRILNDAYVHNELKQDDEDEFKKSYFVKNKHYATSINNIQKQLLSYYKFLNIPMQEQLKVDAQPEYLYGESNSISFPEITQTLTLLAQPQQLVAIKQLDNALQQLREGFLIMEKFNDKSSEAYYVWQVFLLYDSFKDAIILLWFLPTDPYLTQLSSDFQKLSKDFSEQTQQITENYQAVDSQQTGSIFSIVNALMLSPEHLTSIVAKQNLTEIQILDVRQKSAHISNDLHRIIDESSNYFKLFLEISTVYNLSQQLQEKLAVFATVSHDVLLDNLASIKNNLFGNFLQEIDSKEEKLGLQHGLVSLPMHNILDRAFHGMIDQLGLGMDHKIRLMISMRTFELRLEASVTRRRELEALLQDTIDTKALLRLDESTSKTLSDSFKALLPILKKAGVKCQDAYHAVCDRRQTVVDELLNPEVVHQIARDNTRLARVKLLIELCAADLDGLAATHRFALQSNDAQYKYLIEQRDLKRAANEQFTNICLKEKINGLRDSCLGKNSSFYDKALELYLADKTNEMIAAALNGANLDTSIQQLFNTEKSLFDSKFGKYYQQLEVIKGAVAGLEAYLAQDLININLHASTTFEDINTINQKRAQITLIKTIIDNITIDPDKRIEQIREQLNTHHCKDVLLSYKHNHALTYNWWLECVNWLYECLGLYKPERRVHYEKLVTSSSSSFFQAALGEKVNNIITPTLVLQS